jgi:hypothetical protein
LARRFLFPAPKKTQRKLSHLRDRAFVAQQLSFGALGRWRMDKA